MPPQSHPEPRQTFYLTTPIYYVNARPHIGHAYTTIVADVLARRHRLLGHDTFFLTGTDEHGQKIERSAAAAGIPPQQFADQVSATFSNLWQRMGITNDIFMRTTDPRHKQGVQKLFRQLYEQGHIYLSTYTGQYSIGEEMFVEGPPGTIGPDGRPTETVTEENFFFRLSAFQRPLLDLIESNTLKITPDSSRNEVLSFIRGGLKDLSVSRSSFTWGIPVPEDIQQKAETTQPHVIYVWLDALANYMTAIGYGSEVEADQQQFKQYWPANLHLVGKEITRFHCVYWPAFLLALNPALACSPETCAPPSAASSPKVGAAAPAPPSSNEIPELPPEAHAAWAAQWLPKQVTANGWLLFDNSKMSKSKGNVVRTETILEAFGRLCPPVHKASGQTEDASLKGTASAVPSADSDTTALAAEVRPPTKAEQDLFAADILRYYLLREIPFGQDGSFTFEAMITRYNADLVNGYGNLVKRSLSMIEKYFDGIMPDPSHDSVPLIRVRANYYLHLHASTMDEAFHSFEDLAKLVTVETLDFNTVLQSAMRLIAVTDAFLSKQAPWKAAEGEGECELLSRRKAVLFGVAEDIRIITALLYPILPQATAKVWQQLGLDDIEQAAANGDLTNLQWGGLKPGTRLGPLSPIFPRADKSLITLMEDLEAANNPPKEKTMPEPTPDTTQQPAAPTTHPAEPLKDHSDKQDPTHPAAPPRTSTLEAENPGAHVAASNALTTERDGTPSHTEAQASGIFASQLTAHSSQLTAESQKQAPDTPGITIDDFTKIDLRVAKILVAERIPKADKLLRLEVDLGYEQRQILSGIAEHYTPEELIGRKIVIIANLAPRKMRGLESRGMLLAASEGENGKPILATFADEIAVGTRLR